MPLLRRDLDPLGPGAARKKNGLCIARRTAVFPFRKFKGMLRGDGDPLRHNTVRDVPAMA
ncbi:hypothetical protein [Nocardia sp. No.11]|uniref:hypothetical protein n=1 Tax=Nocardia sp. No.11 TaxID=3128861 RepID=UPI00319E6E13